jgi:hypothetical protein
MTALFQKTDFYSSLAAPSYAQAARPVPCTTFLVRMAQAVAAFDNSR